MNRRGFLRTLGAGAAAATCLPAKQALASAHKVERDPYSLLINTTRCIGCRTCEFRCAQAHGLPGPDPATEKNPTRTTSEREWTVVNTYENKGVGEKGASDVHVKRQCMHCLEPACVSACLTEAMYQTPEGPVIWRESKEAGQN